MDEALPPACMKCEAVTGKVTCFPGACVFHRERNTPGSKSHSIATIDRIRRGMRGTVHAANNGYSDLSVENTKPCATPISD